jgi:hypothetical protein
MKLNEAFEEHVYVTIKVGKKKNWIRGKDRFGVPIQVEILKEDICNYIIHIQSWD